ncbi:MAG TPA: proton-translocating transhydrogenase family protein [Rhizomicrobium sp.]|nr:proton-translocating transhydrogenase family protein [Rhizomicrobium sp.]
MVFRLTIFVLAIFVGYFVVWSVTPALHTPLMAVTNAISSVIVVGALIAVSVQAVHRPTNIEISISDDGSVSFDKKVVATNGATLTQKQIIDYTNEAVATVERSAWTSKLLGFFALILASVNIFGGFLVTQRMLAMYKKKEK